MRLFLANVGIRSSLYLWEPGPSLHSDAGSCWLHHGNLLVVDGCCQDEYLQCTDPRLEGERVNVTFRWIRNHLSPCPSGAGVVRCLPRAPAVHPLPPARDSSGRDWFSGIFLWVLVDWGLLALAAFILSGLWWREHAVRRPRLLSCGWCQHCCRFLTVGLGKTRSVPVKSEEGAKWKEGVPYTLAKKGQPSPICNDTYLVFGPRRASGEDNGQNKFETSFPLSFPLLSLGGRCW